MRSPKNIWVYADWVGIHGPLLVGQLSAEAGRNAEVFSFSYDKEWIQNWPALFLDPDLMLFTGPQYTRDEKLNFGVFTDSSPDRWGRTLMQRKESYNAQLEHRPASRLFESDYLLGVADQTRMGGLRFKLDPVGPFLDNDIERPAPPIHHLRALETASYEMEAIGAENNPHYGEWMRILLAPGSSLGGARPKGSVMDLDGHLWIAKFPSRFDEYDIAAWEAVVAELARQAGINVAQGRAERYTGKHHTYLTKRFDRIAGTRIHFSSAMTLLGYTDGADGSEGVSYQHIAEFIMRAGAHPDENMKELWKRMVFNICVSNTDDHLRNHGFLLGEQGWELSPAFDMNPVPGTTHLKLNISEDDGLLSLKLAMEVAEAFRVSAKEAKELMGNITRVVKGWQTVAEKAGITRAEMTYMSSAFDIDARL